MFERFSEGSRAAVVEAEALALEIGSAAITPVHLLYGCAEQREETAGRPLRDAGITGASIRRLLTRAGELPTGDVDPDALRAVGIDYDAVRAAVDGTFGPGALQAAPDRRVPTGRRKPPFSPAAKRCLEHSVRVARELHAARLHPGHLVLGLLRLDDELVTSAIVDAGTTVGALSAAVLSQLNAAA